MSNFDSSFCKVYISTKGWPGIDLGASHESCAHPNTYIDHLKPNIHNKILKLEAALISEGPEKH